MLLFLFLIIVKDQGKEERLKISNLFNFHLQSNVSRKIVKLVNNLIPQRDKFDAIDEINRIGDYSHSVYGIERYFQEFGFIYVVMEYFQVRIQNQKK